MFRWVHKSISRDREGKLIFCIWFLISALFMVCIRHNYSGLTMCYVDAFSLISTYKQEVILPFVSLSILFFIKNDFSCNVVLRRKSVRRIWLCEVLKIFVLSVYFSLIILVWTGGLAKVFSACTYNWNEYNSYFTCFTQGEVLERLSYPLFILLYVISNMFVIFAAGMIILLCYWLTGSYIWGYLFVATYWSFKPETDFFDKYCTAGFKVWLKEINWTGQLLYPALFILILVFAGYVLVKNKEFGIIKSRGRRADQDE